MGNTVRALVLFICFSGIAQNAPTDLKFDKKFYETLDQWVVFPKKDVDSLYLFGYVYLDQQAGFTFNLESSFHVLKNGKFKAIPKDPAAYVKFRLEPDKTATVSLLSLQRQQELALPKEPDWLQYYKTSTEMERMKNTGFHLNHIGASRQALDYLLPAYEKEPHYKGLEFELAFAYNVLSEYDKAVAVLEKALVKDPTNYYLYKELGYAYINLKQNDKADATYKKGISASEKNDIRAEMAINMAQAYYMAKDKARFAEWAAITRKYAAAESEYVKYLEKFEKELAKQ